MAFVWESWRDLRGIESKEVAVERGRKAFGGLLKYNKEGVPCLWGYDVTKPEPWPKGFYPLKEGDRLTLMR